MKDKLDSTIYITRTKYKPYPKLREASLTVKCHKFLNCLFLQAYQPWALAYYALTRFSVPCRQSIYLYLNQLSQIVGFFFNPLGTFCSIFCQYAYDNVNSLHRQ